VTASTEQASLGCALALGGQMLDAARADDWSSVASLQSTCDALLRQEHANTPASHDALRTMQQQYQSLATLVEQARDAVVRERDRQQQTHRALNAYLVASDDC
jgi:DNA-binding transcriptional regulator YbjK